MRDAGQARGIRVALLVAVLALGLATAPSVALADPVAFLPAPGSPIDIKFVNHESLLCGGAPCPLPAPGFGFPAGATLEGIATATSIVNPTTGAAYWMSVPFISPASDATELNAAFWGLTVIASALNVATGKIDTLFAGGTLDIYNIAYDGGGVFVTGAPAGPLLIPPPPGPVPPPGAAQVCPPGGCPPPWLSATYTPYVDPVTGLLITLKASFDPATGSGTSQGWLTVTGGTAFSYFDSNAFLTPGGGVADANFKNTFEACPAPGCAPGWPLVSNDPISAQVAPEPTTLLLWGTSLLGIGAIGRWRRRRQD